MVMRAIFDGPPEEHLTTKESGVFTWDLATNVLHADAALAELFGLDPLSTIAGMPLEAYVARIHTEDRPGVAAAIRASIITGEAYHEEYRVIDGTGSAREVMAFGRCFRDADGIPSQYAGIVFPLMDRSEVPDPVLTHVATAHLHAVEAGRTTIADALEAILEELVQTSRRTVRASTH